MSAFQVERRGFESRLPLFRHKSGLLATKKLNIDVLPSYKRYAQPKLAIDVLSTPLQRLIGSRDLWGRLSSFLSLGEASGIQKPRIKIVTVNQIIAGERM